MNNAIYATTPWAYPMTVKPGKNCVGRPAYTEHEDALFCLCCCPFANEDGCHHAMRECKRIARQKRVERRKLETYRIVKPSAGLAVRWV